MKKQFLVLAGSALLLASCGGNKTDSNTPSQAQIDSAINAKVAQHDAEVAAKNDSTLKAVEAEKAAAEAKEHAHSGGTKKHTEKPTATPEPAPAPAPAPGGMRGHADQQQNTGTDNKPASGGGMRSHADHK